MNFYNSVFLSQVSKALFDLVLTNERINIGVTMEGIPLLTKDVYNPCLRICVATKATDETRFQGNNKKINVNKTDFEDLYTIGGTMG